jgi:hypothetical protein
MKLRVRQVKNLAREAEALLRHLRQREVTGVVRLPEAEFLEACRTWPMAGPGEYGVLLVPEQLTLEEWIAKHSPVPPVHHPGNEVPE